MKKTNITTLSTPFFAALFCTLLFLLIPQANAVELLHSRTLLLQHEFSQLEKKLSHSNDAYLAGQISTRDYYATTQTLWLDRDFDTGDILSSLQLWEKTAPSAYAYATLASFYTDLGYHQRGSRWASETSDAQFQQMQLSFEHSINYLKKSKQHNITILSNYLVMANISKSLPNDIPVLHIIDDNYLYQLFTVLPTPIQIAIYHFFPDIFTPATNTREEVYQHPFFSDTPPAIWQQPAIWNTILFNATPRWGGSYKEMAIIIDKDIPKHIDNFNQQQEHFYYSSIVEDKVRTLYANGEYKKAYQIAKKFTAKNKTTTGINEQAMYLAYKLKDYKSCHQYADKIAQQRPWRSNYWYYVGKCAFKLQKWNSMNRAYKHKILLSGENKYDIFQLGVSYMYLHQYDKAYPLFLKSKAIDPEYKQYTDQYTNYIEKEKPDDMRFKDKSIRELIGTIDYLPTAH